MTEGISLKAMLHWGAFFPFFPHLQLANALAKYCSTTLTSVYFFQIAKHVIEITCAQAISRSLITEDNISSTPSSGDVWWDSSTAHTVKPSPAHTQLLHKGIQSEILGCFYGTSKRVVNWKDCIYAPKSHFLVLLSPPYLPHSDIVPPYSMCVSRPKSFSARI